MSTTLLIIITSITLLVIFGSVYLEIRRQIRPRIKIYFPDGSTRIAYKAKEEINLSINFKNKGWFSLPKPVARNIHLFVYGPSTFLLKELRWASRVQTDVMEAPSGGIFGDMHYLGLPGTVMVNLFHKEEETATILVQMPEKTGRYTFKVAIFSDEGDLGIHELEIIIN